MSCAVVICFSSDNCLLLFWVKWEGTGCAFEQWRARILYFNRIDYLGTAVLSLEWIRSYPDSEKDWRSKEKGEAEDEMVKWHRWLDGHKFEPTPGESGGQRSLECCSPWGHRVRRDLATEWAQQDHMDRKWAVGEEEGSGGRTRRAWCRESRRGALRGGRVLRRL